MRKSAVFAVILGALIVGGIDLPNATSASTTFRYSPGRVHVVANTQLTIEVSNPTGNQAHASAQLLAPSFFIVAAPSVQIAPHDVGFLVFSCLPGNPCAGTPLVLTTNGKLLFNLRFLDPTSNGLVTIFAGQLKRF
jgi:hypothetical protein